MADIELKPCPFCSNSVYVDYSCYFRDYIIYCNDCDMIFTLDDCNASEEDVRAAWNRRAENTDMCERTYIRRCETCTHFVPLPESEEFDICKIQGDCYEIYRDLPYDKCTGYEHAIKEV